MCGECNWPLKTSESIKPPKHEELRKLIQEWINEPEEKEDDLLEIVHIQLPILSDNEN